MKTIFLLLLCCVSMTAQTRQNLQKKYGNTLTESYEVRPDILAKTAYSKNGQICELTFEPKTPGLKFTEEKSDLLNRLVDELVPIEKRGATLLSGFYNMNGMDGSLTVGSLSNYEKLTISRSTNEKKEISFFVSWKDKACEDEFGKPFSFDKRKK
jgi:hypothetical protein